MAEKEDTYLSAECDGAGLAFGAYPSWPWRVVRAALLDLAAEILQVQELPSVCSACELPQVAVKGEVFDRLLERSQMAGVPGVKGGTVHALSLRSMMAPAHKRPHHQLQPLSMASQLRVPLSLNPAISRSQGSIHCIFCYSHHSNWACSSIAGFLLGQVQHISMSVSHTARDDYRSKYTGDLSGIWKSGSGK